MTHTTTCAITHARHNVENPLGDPPNLVKTLPRPIHLDPTMHSARIPLRDPLGTSEKVLISTIRSIALHRHPQKHYCIWQGCPKPLVTMD